MSDDEVLPIERYAEVLAYLNSYPAGDHATLFGRLQVTAGAYREAAAIWSARLASELAGGKPALLLAFARAHNASQYRARLHHLPAHRVRPDETLLRRASKLVATRHEKTVAPTPPGGDAPPAERGVAVPTYLAPVDLREAEVAMPIDPEETQIPKPGVGASSLPFIRAPAASPPPAEPTLPRIDTGTELSEQNPTIFTLQLEDGSSKVVKQLDLLMFSLEAYGTMTRRLAAGEDRQQLLAKAGLSERRFSALASAWASLIQKDPMLGAAFLKVIRGQAK